jgi:hypothetical protein
MFAGKPHEAEPELPEGIPEPRNVNRDFASGQFCDPDPAWAAAAICSHFKNLSARRTIGRNLQEAGWVEVMRRAPVNSLWRPVSACKGGKARPR